MDLTGWLSVPAALSLLHELGGTNKVIEYNDRSAGVTFSLSTAQSKPASDLSGRSHYQVGEAGCCDAA